MHAGHDLFSHTVVYQWRNESDSHADHRVARENLFSEPADPTRPVPERATGRPPRDPFVPAPANARSRVR